MSDYGCVPLCAASKAYGPRVKWWHHEPQCPARAVQRIAESPEPDIMRKQLELTGEIPPTPRTKGEL